MAGLNVKSNLKSTLSLFTFLIFTESRLMTVLITGATGLIGQEIVKQCHEQDINVHYLTTSKSKLSKETNYKGFYWNPDANEIDHKCFEGVSAIINLVGASISKRWTSSYKKEILESRTKTAQLLQQTIKAHNYKVEHVISASAIGIYPSNLTNYYDETFSEVSDTFLGTVVKEWESAVDGFKTLGCKVAKIRIGLVLAKNGGALPEIIKPMKLGAGAAFGSGEQWQSWIHIEDLAKMFVFAIEKTTLQGTFNAVSPNPATNYRLTQEAARAKGKPFIGIGVPAFVLKLMFGEMADMVTGGNRVSSQKIQKAGFDFEDSA